MRIVEKIKESKELTVDLLLEVIEELDKKIQNAHREIYDMCFTPNFTTEQLYIAINTPAMLSNKVIKEIKQKRS